MAHMSSGVSIQHVLRVAALRIPGLGNQAYMILVQVPCGFRM